MKIIIEKSEKSLTQLEFSELEKLFSQKFPVEFRLFFLENNGGYLPESQDVVPLLFSSFIPIKYGKLPIEETYQSLIESFDQLKDLVPFACDQGGNCFLISLREKDYGKIYLWLMDETELAFVCDSFTDFINELS